MGLFGAVGKLGVKSLAKSLDEARTNRINYFKNSGIIRFGGIADTSKYQGLPITYFEVPTDNKQKEIMFEMVSKLLKKPEAQQLASQGATYFIIAGAIIGKATNGILANEKGIWDGSVIVNFIAREDITGIESDNNGCLCIKTKDGVTNYLAGSDNRKIKAESDRFVQLFKEVYNL